MSEESTTVNSLVESHAAKLQETESSSNTEDTQEKDPPAGGADPAKTDPPAVDPPKQVVDYTELFKELGVDSIDSLKEKLKPKVEDKPESPEEKEKRESVYQASLQKYAVENGSMKLEEFTTLENLKAKDDQTLVFENWLPGWKEDNPNVDPVEADRLAKAEFESEYKLNHENDKVKAKGVSKIQKEAAEIRTPLENRLKAVKENYDGVRDVETNFPEFNKKVTGIVKEFIPEKFTVHTLKDKVGEKEEDVPIEVELSPADRVEILTTIGKSILENEKNYALYKKGDFKALQEIAKKETEALISTKYRDAGAQKIAETFLARGTKRSSTTGAKNPFPLVNDGKETSEENVLDAKGQVLKSLRGQ